MKKTTNAPDTKLSLSKTTVKSLKVLSVQTGLKTGVASLLCERIISR